MIASIIIPTYNTEQYIGETIESILAQSIKDWELIIIDDGSSDKTKNIVSNYLSDKRIKYVYQENAGVAAARNNGYGLSKGQFLAFLDADDLWLPNRLEKMIGKFYEDSKVGLVHSYMQVINEHSERQPEIYKGKEGNILESLLLWDGCNIPAPSSILVKREVIDKVGCFDEELSTAADQEFFFRVAHQYKIGMCKEVLGLYRIHDNNMHQNIQRMEADHIKAYQKAEKYQLFSSLQFKKNCFSNLYLILAASWWVNGQNKLRGLFFAAKALLIYPANISKITSRIW